MIKKFVLCVAICCGISGANGMNHSCVFRCGKTADGIDKIVMRNGRSNVNFCSGYKFRTPFGYIVPYRVELYSQMMSVVNRFAVSISGGSLKSSRSPIYEVSRSAVFDVVACALEMMDINVFAHIKGYEPFSNIL